MNACKFALDVQDACNISGVFYGLKRLVEQLNNDYYATAPKSVNRNDWFRSHPALILYLDKMCDMMGWMRDYPESMGGFANAYNRACEYAKEEVPA